MKIVNYILDSNIECSPFNWGLVLFCYGCNLHCKMCEGYNFEKVTDKKNIIGNAIDIIKKSITPIHDTVVFLGGEPTIYEDKLIESLKYCKENNLKTKIFTNGIKHDTIAKINSLNLCDAWSVDLKGINNLKHEIGIDNTIYLTSVLYSISDIIYNNIPLEIRTTFYDGNISDMNKIENLARSIINDGKRHNGKDYNIKWIKQSDARGII